MDMRMNSRIVVMFGMILLFACNYGVARASVLIRTKNVAFLSHFEKHESASVIDRIVVSLHRHGLIENKNFRLQHFQLVNSDQKRAFRAALDAGKFDIVFSANTSPAEWVFSQSISVPHVFWIYADPVARGWVKSMDNHGGATGVIELAPMHAKRIQMLASVVPQLKRVGIFLDKEEPYHDILLQINESEVKNSIVILPIFYNKQTTEPELRSEVARLRLSGAYIPLVGTIDTQRLNIINAVNAMRVPSIAERILEVNDGALLAVQVDRRAVIDRVASVLSHVIRGTPPSQIPIETPSKFVIGINLRTSRLLHIEFSRSVLRGAAHFVE